MGQGGPGTKSLPNSTGSGNSGKYNLYVPTPFFLSLTSVCFNVFSSLFRLLLFYMSFYNTMDIIAFYFITPYCRLKNKLLFYLF